MKPDGVIYCYEPDDKYLSLYPENNFFNELVLSWQNQVIEDGCDPFVGRKLPLLFSQAGFRNVRVKPILKTYTNADSDSFFNAIQNLIKIFRPKGMREEEFSRVIESVSSITNESFLSEGYISLVAQK